MSATQVHACAAVLLLGACSDPSSTFDWQPPDDPDLPRGSDPRWEGWMPGAAVPDADVPDDVQVLYMAADTSIHELVTCSGALRSLVQPMVIRIVAGAEGLIEPAALETLASAGFTPDTLGEGFSHEGDRWRMAMGGAAGGTFDVRFAEPSGRAITEDVFALDTYVQGATATSSRTWEEMMVDVGEPVDFAFPWEEEGPLAHLLEPLTDPIRVRASLMDLAGMVFGAPWEADLGSFEGIGDMVVTGDVPFADERGGVEVAYDGHLGPVDVRSLLSGEPSALSVDAIAVEGPTGSAQATDIDLVALRAGLAGTVTFEVSGAEATWEVVADFGQGASYPESHWRCLDGC